MRRKCRYIAALCAAACLGAGAPAQVYAQEAGGADGAETEVTFTAGNDGAMTAAAEPGKIAPVRYEKGSYVVGRDIPAGEYAVFASTDGDGNPYRTCSFTLYKNDSDEKRIGTFRFEHHGLVTLYDGQHLVLQSGYAAVSYTHLARRESWFSLSGHLNRMDILPCPGSLLYAYNSPGTSFRADTHTSWSPGSPASMRAVRENVWALGRSAIPAARKSSCRSAKLRQSWFAVRSARAASTWAAAELPEGMAPS